MHASLSWLRNHFDYPWPIDTNYQEDTWRFELVNIEYWGKSIPAQLFKQFPNHVIRALNHEFYDTMMDDSQKIEAIYAYDDREKDAMKERIIHYNTGMFMVLSLTVKLRKYKELSKGVDVFG